MDLVGQHSAARSTTQNGGSLRWEPPFCVVPIPERIDMTFLHKLWIISPMVAIVVALLLACWISERRENRASRRRAAMNVHPAGRRLDAQYRRGWSDRG